MYPLVISHSYGKPAFLLGKLTMSMAMSHSYLNLPEGNLPKFATPRPPPKPSKAPRDRPAIRSCDVQTSEPEWWCLAAIPSWGSLYWLVEQVSPESDPNIWFFSTHKISFLKKSALMIHIWFMSEQITYTSIFWWLHTTKKTSIIGLCKHQMTEIEDPYCNDSSLISTI